MKRFLTFIVPVLLSAVLLQSARPAPAKVQSANIYWSWDDSEWTATYYFKISVNGTVVLNVTDDGWGEFQAPAGSTVKFEVSVDPSWILTVNVNDDTVSEQMYYEDGETTISYSFTAIDGHQYVLFGNGH